MNNVINKYLIQKFLKVLFNFIMVFICIGIILSLFEEIEFFKNLDVSLNLPLMLTLLVIPNWLIKLMPFIIFFSAMWYLISAQINKDLLNLKIFGVSNLKITTILSILSFSIGLIIIFLMTPITSALVTKYEATKARYSKDVDHLVSINKNGVWIKESYSDQIRITNAKKIEDNYLIDVSIKILNKDFELLKRIRSERVNIIENKWEIEKPIIFDSQNQNKIGKNVLNYYLVSNYNLNKLQSLYKNLDTISFLDIVYNKDDLLQKGYQKSLLYEKLNLFISFPFFLLIMVVLASIFTLGTTRKFNNLRYLFLAIITGVVIFYLRDLSLALGKTGFIHPILSIWVPILAISLYCSIGLIQINEK